jgi:chloramphenicol-sensitive protein RarD
MKNGIIFGVVAYLLWGLLPLYWKVFDSMGAWEILSQRILWSFISMGMILYGVKRWKDLREVLSEPKSRLGIILASAAITVNWMIYIWAVNADHVVETSLGYYMNPLINILFAVVFLKERLRSLQWIAIGVAALGVILMTIQLGHFPWISIALAISFSCYGLTKKLVKIDSLIGLSGETLVSLPFAMAYLVFIHQQGTDTFLHQPLWVMILMILSGIATAVPLLLFSEATKRISFALVGFIQYLSPTTTLILAIYVFRESFTRAEFMNFSLIWLSLIIYTWGSLSPKQKESSVEETA